jgi:hypothetical protein
MSDRVDLREYRKKQTEKSIATTKENRRASFKPYKKDYGSGTPYSPMFPATSDFRFYENTPKVETKVEATKSAPVKAEMAMMPKAKVSAPKTESSSESFSQAFARNKKSGAKEFEFKGKRFTTQTKQEAKKVAKPTATIERQSVLKPTSVGSNPPAVSALSQNLPAPKTLSGFGMSAMQVYEAKKKEKGIK